MVLLLSVEGDLIGEQQEKGVLRQDVSYTLSLVQVWCSDKTSRGERIFTLGNSCSHSTAFSR